MKNFHHATLHRANSVSTFEITSFNEEVDINDFNIERFGIEDARELVRKAYQRPFEASRQLLVVRTNFITLEAQNALLKVLEEPPLSTNFAFVVPHDLVVLSTLLSRMSCESLDTKEIEENNNIAFQNFLDQNYKERLISIEQSAKKQDIEWQRQLKQGLVQYVSKQDTSKTHKLKELEYVTRMLLTRGASNKMLLEHAAVILPTR